MRVALTVVVALTFIGCGSDRILPTLAAPSPPSPPTDTAFVVVLVVEPGGTCIADAKIEVIAGQAVGRTVTQGDIPWCDAWATGYGVRIDRLAPFVPMTVRASAPGFIAKESTVTPSASQAYQSHVIALPAEPRR